MKRDKLQKMGRRRFMKVASAMGISASSLHFGTQEGLAKAMDSPEKEVSYVSHLRVVTDGNGVPTGQEPIYSSIPRDEWADVEATLNAQRRITELLRQKFPKSPTLHASVARMEESPTGLGVVVAYATKQKSDGTVVRPSVSRERVREGLPDAMEATAGKDQWSTKRTEIPVKVTEKYTMYNAGGYSGKDWSQIPAGCVVNGGTSCTSFYHEGYDEYCLITAGHVVGSASSSDEWGNPTKGDKDGWVEKKVEKLHKDYALLRAYSTNIDSMLRNDSDSSPETEFQIYGIVTNDEIQSEYLRTGKSCKYQGHVTGRVSTTVQNWDDTQSLNTSYETQLFQVDQSAQDGDSGGVIYEPDSDGYGTWIMGVIMDYGENSYGARCNTAELIENSYNGYIH